MTNADLITSEMLLPEVIEHYPQTRAVFDKYGLKGCGGPKGPRETIAWFARLHGVSLDVLIRELNETASNPQKEVVGLKPSIGDTIYRPFFLTGFGTVLSLGCLWGTINLFVIGTNHNFRAIDYSWVLAHGHAMVFGFVGAFIMGFAYQAFPRFKHTELWNPKLAFFTLSLMITGISLQALAHLFAPQTAFMFLGVVAGLIQLAAVSLFVLVITKTMRQAHKTERFDAFIKAALGWFLLVAIANPVIFWLFEENVSREEHLFRIATFNIPYRDVQLLGIAVVMILGVSLRFLPHAYGLQEPSNLWRSFLLYGINGAILVGVVSFLTGMFTGQHFLLLGQVLATLVLLVAAIGTPRQYRLFGQVPEEERDRGLKFIRAAYIWFIVATTMLVLVPIYNFAIYVPLTSSPVPFSHAFFGAYRHALTVGFVMMMIVGVSSKVVPTLSGVDVRSANSLWLTFLLVNFGNALRVSTEIATDFTQTAYPLMGVSGFLEVIGLSLWVYELVQNMRSGKRLERETIAESAGLQTDFALTPQTKVAEVLKHHPQTLQVFLHHGFTPLGNPVLRQTMARVITIEQACRRENVSLDVLLSDLQNAIIKEEEKSFVNIQARDGGKNTETGL